MLPDSLPVKAQEVLLQDAARRDLSTARRLALFEILRHEHLFTREQLIARVEGRLGKDCFGKLAWEDTFYRDMRVVKQALKAAGYRLRVRRNKPAPAYYLQDQPALSPEIAAALAGSVADVNPLQLEISRRLSPADRFRQGCSISDTARNVVAYRIRQQYPDITPAEAGYRALQRQAT